MIYKFSVLLITLMDIVKAAPSNLINPFAITSGNCEKNISVKYQIPVTRTRVTQQQQQQPQSQQHQNIENDIFTYTEQYVDYEERLRWDTVHMCCPGYRTIIFGLCEPICTPACPEHSYCAEPNKCICMRGYEPSHHPNKEHQLICRPICMGGCPEHSHCKAHNKCECRAGFKDVSAWFATMRCERIQCAAADQRYDVQKHNCIKIEMLSVEQLMQKVGEKLADGVLNKSKSYDDDDDGDENYDNDEAKDEVEEIFHINLKKRED